MENETTEESRCPMYIYLLTTVRKVIHTAIPPRDIKFWAYNLITKIKKIMSFLFIIEL